MSDACVGHRKLTAGLAVAASLSVAVACTEGESRVAPPAPGEAVALGEFLEHDGRIYPDQRLIMPVNDLPNPYELVWPWAELPSGPIDPGDYDGRPSFIGTVEGQDGYIYALSRCMQNSCVGRAEPPLLRLDQEGKLLFAWGEGLMNFPHGLSIDPEGYLWVADQGNHTVLKFSTDGELVMRIGETDQAGEPPNQLTQPTAVAVAPNGDIFITEGHNNNGPVARVSKFAADGTFLMSWGGFGTGIGEFRTPHTIAFDSQGRVFVGDRHNNRIQIFDQDGNFLDLWYQFGRPSGIAISPEDRIYVADSESYDFHNPGWKKGIRIGSARDGSVEYFIEDVEATTVTHSGAESVGIDSEGNVYGGVVRRRMLERYEPRM